MANAFLPLLEKAAQLNPITKQLSEGFNTVNTQLQQAKAPPPILKTVQSVAQSNQSSQLMNTALDALAKKTLSFITKSKSPMQMYQERAGTSHTAPLFSNFNVPKYQNTSLRMPNEGDISLSEATTQGIISPIRQISIEQGSNGNGPNRIYPDEYFLQVLNGLEKRLGRVATAGVTGAREALNVPVQTTQEDYLATQKSARPITSPTTLSMPQEGPGILDRLRIGYEQGMKGNRVASESSNTNAVINQAPGLIFEQIALDMLSRAPTVARYLNKAIKTKTVQIPIEELKTVYGSGGSARAVEFLSKLPEGEAIKYIRGDLKATMNVPREIFEDIKNAFRPSTFNGPITPAPAGTPVVEGATMRGRVTDLLNKIIPPERAVQITAENAPGFIDLGSQAERGMMTSQKDLRTNLPRPGIETPASLDPDVAQSLRQAKGLSVEDIITKHPDINLKRDVSVTDIHGNKSIIDAGEALTPYELKGNKVLLQDGQTYIVSKNQYKNIKGNAVSGEAKDFAPELKGTEETVKGTSTKEDAKALQEKAYNDWTAGKITIEERNKMMDQLNTMIPQQTKYSSYQLPGGENYKEVLIKAPQSEMKTTLESKGYKFENKPDGTIEVTTPTGTKVGRWKSMDSAISAFAKDTGSFQSSHWDEPNVISHLRLNERTYKGQKVTFMEELQSDWAREARKNPQSNKIDTVELEKEMEAKYNELAVLDKKGQGETQYAQEIADELAVLEEDLMVAKRNASGVNSNPLLKNWQELSIKRALQEAVNNGSEYFAWINGEQTSTRYSLATHLEKVSWRNLGNDVGDKKGIVLNPKGGDQMSLYIDDKGIISNSPQSNWDGKKLDEVIGKGLADKIMADEKGTLSGEGLKFGGEWADTLYDKQVANIVKDLTGAKVEVLDLGLPVDGKKTSWYTTEKTGDYRGGSVTKGELTPESMKVGELVKNSSGDYYVITDVIGDGKFKAVPKGYLYQIIDKPELLRKLSGSPIGEIKVNGELKNYYPISQEQSFDISTKKSAGQQGIKITPEIRALVKGEALPMKKPSGVSPIPKQESIQPGKAEFAFKQKPREGNITEQARTEEALKASKETKLPEISVLEEQLKEAYRAAGPHEQYPEYTKADEIMSHIYTELEISVPKQNVFGSDGEGFLQVIDSTFPQWIPQSLRLSELFGKIKDRLEVSAIKFPEGNRPKQRGLYNVLLDKVDERLGIDTSEIRNQIIKAYEQPKPKRQNIISRGGSKNKGAVHSGTPGGEGPNGPGEKPAEVKSPEEIQKERVASFELAKKINELAVTRTNQNGDFLISVNGKIPRRGFAYEPYPDTGLKVSKSEFSAESIRRFRSTWEDVLKQDNTFIKSKLMKDGTVSIDIAKLKPTQEEAINAAPSSQKRNIKDVEADRTKRANERMEIATSRKERVQRVRAIQSYWGLSDKELQEITRRDIRLMGEREYENFLVDLDAKALEFQKTADARNEVLSQIQEKELKNVDNLIKALKMKPIDKMNADQLNKLNEALLPYQRGDEFFSVRRLETVDNTDLKGIKTLREAKERLALDLEKKYGIPKETPFEIKVKELDRYKYDTALAERDPFYKLMIDETTKSFLDADATFAMMQHQVNKLIIKARASRKKTLGEKFGDFISPTDKHIFEWLEAKDKTDITNLMTPQELQAASFIRAQFAWMRDYLIGQGVLKRFQSDYVTHMRRGFLETLREDGPLAAFRDMFDAYKEEEAVFNILDTDTGNILPLEKFFQYSMQRTGSLVPSQNVARVFESYTKTFLKKKALDQIIPKLDIYVQAMAPKMLTPRGLELDRSLKKFFNEWMNNKKGRKATKWLKQGGKLDLIARAIKTVTVLHDLALNVPAGIASQGGEQAANYIMLGNKAYVKGLIRQNTVKGKIILKKYENFIGKNPWSEILEASKNISEKTSEALFVLFRDASVRANKGFLLGSMSDAEWARGSISTERLADLKREMGRYRVTEGSKSIHGSTTEGGLATQYKTWAIPSLTTTLRDGEILITKLKSEGFSALKSKESNELFRSLVVVTGVVLTAAAIFGDPNDKSLFGKIRTKALSDAMSVLSSLDPKTIFSVPRTLQFLADLSSAVSKVVFHMQVSQGLSDFANIAEPVLFKQLEGTAKKLNKGNAASDAFDVSSLLDSVSASSDTGKLLDSLQ